MTLDNDKRLWSLATGIVEILNEKTVLQERVVELVEIVSQQDAEIRKLSEDREPYSPRHEEPVSYTPDGYPQDVENAVEREPESLVDIMNRL